LKIFPLPPGEGDTGLTAAQGFGRWGMGPPLLDKVDKVIKTMLDFSLIMIVPAEESFREFSYQVKKSAEGGYVKEIFGWDEVEQRAFHSRDWEQKKPMIISYDGEPIGTIYIGENRDFIEIGQFFISPDYQNRGIGTYVLRQVIDKAEQTGLAVKLAYLKNNPVASLYHRHGFKVVDNNEQFFFTERRPRDSV
jgi:GNAT superfamily N-acetyltransferase